MATDFSRYNNTEADVFIYLSRRLFARCNKVYGLFFLIYKMGICYHEMVELDQLLLVQAPNVYKELEKLYRFESFKYHFVKSWRTSNYPRKLWMLWMGLSLGNLFKKI